MKQASIIGFAVLFVLGSMCSGQTDAAPGNIHLLPGFVHHRVPSIDSGAGTITRTDGLVIEYDIGQNAGVYTDCGVCGWTRGELWRRQQVIAGHEVRTVFTKSKRLVISFPATHANFHAVVRSQADLVDVMLIVLSYSPS